MQYTELDLKEAIRDYIDSCFRTGKCDDDENIEYFMQENKHMDLNRSKVKEIYYNIMAEFAI